MYAPWMSASSVDPAADDDVLAQEIDTIANAVAEMGRGTRKELAERIHAHTWGPGRFRTALREAAREGRVEWVSRSVVEPPR